MISFVVFVIVCIFMVSLVFWGAQNCTLYTKQNIYIQNSVEKFYHKYIKGKEGKAC